VFLSLSLSLPLSLSVYMCVRARGACVSLRAEGECCDMCSMMTLTHSHTHSLSLTHSLLCWAGVRVLLPIPLRKSEGEEEDAWAIKDSAGKTVLTLCFAVDM